jgi:hypothetical protein
MTLHHPTTLTTKRSLSSIFIISLLILFSSCSKGDAGPAGPAGPAGAAGTTGATGATGATGSANVQYSAWVTPPSYIKDTVFGTWGFYYNWAVPGITQPILDSGTVLVYGKLDGYVTSIWPTTQVALLPIVIEYMYGSNANIDTWSDLVTLGKLKIQLQSSLNAYGGISNAHKFRYIIIPGGAPAPTAAGRQLQNGKGNSIETSSARMGASQEKVDYTKMTYEEVCQRLGIAQ